MVRNYSIGEVAKRLGVSNQSLRYWESQGFIPEAERHRTNRRTYTEENIQTIEKWLENRNQ